MRSRLLPFAGLVLCAGLAGGASGDPSFQGLRANFHAAAMSGDGSTVVGVIISPASGDLVVSLDWLLLGEGPMAVEGDRESEFLLHSSEFCGSPRS